jgi:thiopeptide-type bacteriocin biosynthesis protein
VNLETTQRTFIPGSEWVYYKVYCGINTADQILTEVIQPLAQQLIAKKIISKWFFIRYADPDSHLRIRFHLVNTKDIHQVLLSVSKALSSYVEDKLISDLQLATYQRELERYGSNTIDLLESLFYHDSLLLVNIIRSTPEARLRFQQMYDYTEYLISLFIPEIEERLSFLDRMQEGYKTEFGATSSVSKKSMGKKYRSFQSEQKLPSLANDFSSLEAIAKEILEINNKKALKLPLHDLLSSIVHMSVNRVFQSRQRLYEMVLYDFLFQKTRSDFYRQKKRK